MFDCIGEMFKISTRASLTLGLLLGEETQKNFSEPSHAWMESIVGADCGCWFERLKKLDYRYEDNCCGSIIYVEFVIRNHCQPFHR